MFPMTVTINSKAQLDAVMQALAAGNDYAKEKAIQAEPDQKSEEKAEGKKPNRSAAQTAEKSTPATDPAASPSEPETPAIEYADVSKAIIALAKDKGRDAAVAVLGQFGASKATDLKPEQYAAAIKAAQQALGGAQ